jgi:hypothetical protein
MNMPLTLIRSTVRTIGATTRSPTPAVGTRPVRKARDVADEVADQGGAAALANDVTAVIGRRAATEKDRAIRAAPAGRQSRGSKD